MNATSRGTQETPAERWHRQQAERKAARERYARLDAEAQWRWDNRCRHCDGHRSEPGSVVEIMHDAGDGCWNGEVLYSEACTVCNGTGLRKDVACRRCKRTSAESGESPFVEVCGSCCDDLRNEYDAWFYDPERTS